MKSQTVILLIVAGACGLVAMLGIKQYMAKRNNRDEVPKKQVLVALGPIKPGVMLSEQNTQLITVEASTCPEGVVVNLEQIKQRALKVPRGQGDWIFVSQLTEEGDTGLGGTIPSGMRVMTIPVDATMTNSGMLQPGNRIDLFATYRENQSGVQKEKTVLVLEYIEVFAVESQVYGRDASTDNAKARNISLLVDLEQAMKLTVATRKGAISTVLRSTEDMDKTMIAEVTEDILNGVTPGEIDQRSALDVGDQVNNGIQGFSLPAEEPNIMAQLRAELETNGPSGSGPLQEEERNDDDDFWTMAIHEAGAVRVVKVNTRSEEPIDTSRSKTPAGVLGVPSGTPSGAGGGFSLPPGFEPAAAGSGAGKDTDTDKGGLEELEEAASGLLDLF